MRFAKKNFLIVFWILLISSVNLCDGKDKKHDKHKHKNESHHKDESKQQQSQQKNSTVSHQNNHTAAHNASDDHAIGWSLHNNPNQPAHESNPHGYAVQHHDSSHGVQPNYGSQYPIAQQPQATPQSSGPSALASGLGGMALGAVGGAAGGYLLSKALDSDKSSEDTKDEATTEISETTLAALTESSTIAAELSSPIIAAETTKIAAEASPSIIPIESSSISAETSATSESSSISESTNETVNVAVQKAPVVSEPYDTNTQPPTTTDNDSVVWKFSLPVLAMSIIATLSQAI